MKKLNSLVISDINTDTLQNIIDVMYQFCVAVKCQHSADEECHGASLICLLLCIHHHWPKSVTALFQGFIWNSTEEVPESEMFSAVSLTNYSWTDARGFLGLLLVYSLPSSSHLADEAATPGFNGLKPLPVEWTMLSLSAMLLAMTSSKKKTSPQAGPGSRKQQMRRMFSFR